MPQFQFNIPIFDVSTPSKHHKAFGAALCAVESLFHPYRVEADVIDHIVIIEITTRTMPENIGELTDKLRAKLKRKDLKVSLIEIQK